MISSDLFILSESGVIATELLDLAGKALSLTFNRLAPFGLGHSQALSE